MNYEISFRHAIRATDSQFVHFKIRTKKNVYFFSLHTVYDSVHQLNHLPLVRQCCFTQFNKTQPDDRCMCTMYDVWCMYWYALSIWLCVCAHIRLFATMFIVLVRFVRQNVGLIFKFLRIPCWLHSIYEFRSNVNKLWLLFCKFTYIFFHLIIILGHKRMHAHDDVVWLCPVFFLCSFYYSCCCCCCHVVIDQIQMKSKAAGIEPNMMVYYYHIAYKDDSVSSENLCELQQKRII